MPGAETAGEERMTKPVLWAILLLPNGLALLAQPLARPSETKSAIKPWQTLEPMAVTVRLGQRVRVLPRTGPAGTPAIAVAVLDSERNLLDRDDELTESSDFIWAPGRDGTFYLVIRNLSETDGECSVIIEPAPLEMRGGESKEWATKEVFYATNREVDGSLRQDRECGTPQAPRFGGGLGYKLSLGVSYVNVKRSSRKMGELEAFSVVRIFTAKMPSEKSVVISCINPSAETDFYEKIGKKVKSSQQRRVLVFIHGYRNTFEHALLRAAQIAYDLRVDGPPILFSWPSQGTLEDYLLDRSNADASYHLLSDFLQRIARETQAAQIDVIAHSMGSWVLVNALREIALRMDGKQPLPVLRNVAMMAPDVDVGVLRGLIPGILRVAERTTLYGSSRDGALIASATLNRRARAGQGQPDIFRAAGLDTIDASKVDTSLFGANHQYFGDSSTILYDLDQLFLGRVPDHRLNLRRESGSGATYYVFE